FVRRCQSRAVSNGAATVRNAPTATPLQMWPCAALGFDLFTRKHPSRLLPGCKGVQSVAELEIFGTRGSDCRCVLADTCILHCASSWRDSDKSQSWKHYSLRYTCHTS